MKTDNHRLKNITSNVKSLNKKSELICEGLCPNKTCSSKLESYESGKPGSF
jgi:hypothetical protein